MIRGHRRNMRTQLNRTKKVTHFSSEEKRESVFRRRMFPVSGARQFDVTPERKRIEPGEQRSGENKSGMIISKRTYLFYKYYVSEVSYYFCIFQRGNIIVHTSLFFSYRFYSVVIYIVYMYLGIHYIKAYNSDSNALCYKY